MSERVTWETCPLCKRPAAVGWLNGRLVEFDCPAGCAPSEGQMRGLADRRHSPAGWLTR